MDLSEAFDACVKELKAGVKSEFERIGAEAVNIAKQSVAYHDVTGNLRKSNRYEASEERLVIRNTADYASHVEARTGDVIANAVLYARNELAK